jgi:hypothetical protein
VIRPYVYALVERRHRSVKIAGRRIEFMNLPGMYAAVERRAAAPEPTEGNLRLQHRIVVELARRVDAILPVTFGAWVDADELHRVLAPRRDQMLAAFDLVRHRQQMTVRIFGSPPPSAPRGRSSSRRGPGSAYLARHLKALPPEASRIVRAIRRAAASLVVAERLEPGRRRMIATIHHLIDRRGSREYRAAVSRALHSTASRFEVVVSGPWPPFAFTPRIWGS